MAAGESVTSDVVPAEASDSRKMAEVLHNHYQNLFGVVTETDAARFLEKIHPDNDKQVAHIANDIAEGLEHPTDPTRRHYLKLNLGEVGLVGWTVLAPLRYADLDNFTPPWQRNLQAITAKVKGTADSKAPTRRYIPELVIQRQPLTQGVSTNDLYDKLLNRGLELDVNYGAKSSADYYAFAAPQDTALARSLTANQFTPGLKVRPVPRSGNLPSRLYIRRSR